VNSLDNAADNEIIGTALYVKRNTGRYTSSRVKDVVLVSTDRNMRIAAVNYGLTAKGVKRGESTADKVLSVVMYCTCFIAATTWWMCNPTVTGGGMLGGPLAKYSVGVRMVGLASVVITGILMFIYLLRRNSSYEPHDDSDCSQNDYIYDPAYSDYFGNVYHDDHNK